MYKTTFIKRRIICNIFILTICTIFTILICIISDKIEFTRLQEPKPLSETLWLYPLNLPLLNLNNFNYEINNDVCQNKQHKIIAVIIITSHAGDIEIRNTRRNAFPNTELQRLGLKRVFLLAKPNPKQLGYKYIKQETIDNENKKYKDIIQGNFEESYRNLSYKHVMGLKWATTYCKHVKYIIKLDDDIAVNYYKLLDTLNKYNIDNSIVGYKLDKLIADRGSSKWKVSFNEWSSKYYPSFVSGWLYAVTPSTALKLINTLQVNKTFFWIDDVLVTGIAREKSNVNIINIGDKYSVHAENLYCCVQYKNCDFIIAPSSGDFRLLKSFMKYITINKGLINKSNHECIVTVNPFFIPWSQEDEKETSGQFESTNL